VISSTSSIELQAARLYGPRPRQAGTGSSSDRRAQAVGSLLGGVRDKVVTRVGGGMRDVLHPSVQVMQYRNYLQDSHTAFYEGGNPIRLASCAYLHNYPYQANDVLFSQRFERYLATDPLFTADHVDELIGFLSERVSEGRGEEILKRVEKGSYRPSKQLLEHVGHILDGAEEYVLLDEQLIAFERVLASAVQAMHSRKKSIILVRGGRGRGSRSLLSICLPAYRAMVSERTTSPAHELSQQP